jgi:hypothetical protein
MENTKPIPDQTWQHKSSGNAYAILASGKECLVAGDLRDEYFSSSASERESLEQEINFSADMVFYTNSDRKFVRREADFLNKFELIEEVK